MYILSKFWSNPTRCVQKLYHFNTHSRSSQGHSYGPQGAWEHSTYSLSSSYHSLGGRPRCVFLRIRAMLLFAPLLYCGLGMAADLYRQNTKSAPISWFWNCAYIWKTFFWCRPRLVTAHMNRIIWVNQRKFGQNKHDNCCAYPLLYISLVRVPLK